MTYFPALRRDYILWRLAVHGELRRADIMRTFGIDLSSASVDINRLLTEQPDAARYDKTAKMYMARHHAPPARLTAIAAALAWD